MTYEVQLQLGSVQYTVRGPETDGVLSLIERLQTIGRQDPLGRTYIDPRKEPTPEDRWFEAKIEPGFAEAARKNYADMDVAMRGDTDPTPLPKIEEPTGAWIEWTGTTSPVRAHAKVQVKLASGYESGIVPAHTVEWNSKSGSHYAIVAYRVVNPEPSEDGWITWVGGDCPLHDADVPVDYRMRDGMESTGIACTLRWGHTVGFATAKNDIVAYRTCA